MRKPLISILLMLALLSGCTQNAGDIGVYTGKVTIGEILFGTETVALAATPAISDSMMPTAPGTAVKKNERAIIDYSNSKDGYVMVNFTDATNKNLKVRVTGPSATQYTYNLAAGQWTTFPLSDGNGAYQITIFENTTDSKYATVLTAEITAALADEFAPFLRPNQYVDYAEAANTVAKAAELTGSITEPLHKVETVYSFVTDHLTYDKEKAKNVQSGYLPVLDDVLEKGKGICFDYAALMTAMLRSQNVPCKLVVGYAGEAYHAWISVWTEDSGWIDGVIYFDGTAWQRMDPTFASSGKKSDAIMHYIGDGKNYNAMYLY